MQEFGEMAVLCPLVERWAGGGESWLDPLQTPRGSLQPQHGRDSGGGAGDSRCHSSCSWSV